MSKIYYLSSEIDPFSKVTSVATFSKEFSSIANNDKKNDIRLINPKYGYISDRRFILREVIRLKDLLIEFDGSNHSINLKSGFIPNTKVQVYFMQHKDYFDNVTELIYKSKNGRVYNNNNEKFSFFSYAALNALSKLFWIPDSIVYNDWHTSIVPILIDQKFSEHLSNTKKVFIVYDIDNYDIDASVYKKLDLELSSKDKKQNQLIKTINHSDLIFFLNDENDKVSKFIKKNKAIKSCLKNKNYKLINYNTSMPPDERIEVYNEILLEINK